MHISTKLALLFTLSLAPLLAEVQQVVLTWQPGLCRESCVKMLYTELGKIRGMGKVSIDAGGGRAYLTWGPKEPFSFAPLNAATRFIGIRPDLVLLRVRGKVLRQGNDIKLKSEGDGTLFTLINPAIPDPKRATVIYNAQNRPLSPQLKESLLQAEKEDSFVVIEGPFFEPYRSPPNYLTVEKMTVEPKPEPQKKPRQP